MNNNLPMAVPYLVSGYCGVYPGVSTRPIQRGREHLTALRNGRHFNEDLQKAADENGRLSFVYLTFEPVPFEEASKAEQKILDQVTDAGLIVFNKNRAPSRPHPVGYKLSPRTRRRQSRAKKGNKNAAKHFVFISPSGQIVETVSLSELCARYDLDISAMSRVQHLKQDSHQGWKRGEI
jgi:hypothetical protein